MAEGVARRGGDRCWECWGRDSRQSSRRTKHALSLSCELLLWGLFIGFGGRHTTPGTITRYLSAPGAQRAQSQTIEASAARRCIGPQTGIGCVTLDLQSLFAANGTPVMVIGQVRCPAVFRESGQNGKAQPYRWERFGSRPSSNGEKHCGP